MDVRPAGPDDIDAVVETITLAFRHDPVWGPALVAADNGEKHLRPYWRVYVAGALRHDTVFVSGDNATASVWIPPGETELSPEDESELRELVADALEPERANALHELWERFEDNHRCDEPHAYLSLLATRPAFAGHGYGQAHLAADLARWDAAGVPTYLESSNPANNHRYARQGYLKVGQFETVVDRAVVTTMWRPVGG
jgi:GNAT superfamily N-acetyltransferase